MSKRLENQSAVVTGASNGIGAACAIECARQGANVVINFHSDESSAKEVAKRCKDLGVKTLVIKADVSNSDDVNKLFAASAEEFARIDVLISNAGIQEDASFLEMSYDAWQKVISVNLDGQFLCAQAASRIFCKQGLDESISKAAGKIVHMSSVHELIPWPGHVNYAAAKGGVDMLMKSVAHELASARIRINSVAPGAIKTDINQDVWQDEEKKRELLKLVPYGRLGEVEDIAKPAVWLASDEADYITGSSLLIDGGMSLYPSFKDNG